MEWIFAKRRTPLVLKVGNYTIEDCRSNIDYHIRRFKHENQDRPATFVLPEDDCGS